MPRAASKRKQHTRATRSTRRSERPTRQGIKGMIKTSARAQIPVPGGAGARARITWFVDKNIRHSCGVLTEVEPQKGRKGRTPRFHLQLFPNSREREEYWKGSGKDWDDKAHFFRFKQKVLVDSEGQWWVASPSS